MKVILLQKVTGLGNADEVKEVAEGYARNFLFPKHLAVQASGQAMQERDAHHRKLAKEAEQDLKIQESLAERLDGLEIELFEKCNENGLLYAAVTPKKVSEALAKMNLAVDAQHIHMRPIKELGNAEATIKLQHGLEATVALVVSPKK